MTIFRTCIAILLLLVATSLGIVLSWDAGYVAVGIQGWELEMSLAVAVLTLLIIGFFCYVILKLIRMLIDSNRNLARWFQSKRANQASRQTLLAVEAETNGNTVEAIRLLEAAGKTMANPVLHLLRASELATRIGALEKAEALRNDAIKACGDQTPAFSRLSSGLAELENGDVKKGAAQLKRLLEDQPNCAPALLALIKHSQKNGDWVTAIAYTDVLARLSYTSEQQIEELSIVSWLGRIQETNSTALRKLWRQVPRHLKQNERVHRKYTEALAKEAA